MQLNPTPTLARLNPHLFASPVSRPAAGVERESDLHEQIFDHCRKQGWIALHGSMAERTHRTAGEPDFVIIADHGFVFFIECKSKHGKLSPAQNALRHQAATLGHTFHVVHSMDEFLEVVK